MAQRGKTLQEVADGRKMEAMTNVNGTPIVTFEEQRDLAQDVMKEHINLGIRPMNANGTVARSITVTAAVNEDRFYDNRYRLVDDKMQLVTAQTTDGYRVITEQQSGRVAYKQIPVYVFERRDKKLVFVEMEMVSDQEFIADFTHKLNAEAMKEILPLLPTEGSRVSEGEKMPI